MGQTDKSETENRRAVIDVGSNSVKLLIADVDNGKVMPIKHEGEQTRLGRGSFVTGRLDVEAIADTSHVVNKFISLSKGKGAGSIRAIATSAAREAKNTNKLVEAIAKLGLNLEIIDGKTEAQLVLRGVRSHPEFRDGLLSVIDVGGGSTELMVVNDDEWLHQKSHPLGTVRLLDQFKPSDHPTADEQNIITKSIGEFFDKHITPDLKNIPLPDIIVGAGGTPVFLAQIFANSDELSQHETESITLSLVDIQRLTDKLWSLPLEDRRNLPGLPANRADVILIGAVIYKTVMKQFGFSELRPTLRGVRYGALLD